MNTGTIIYISGEGYSGSTLLDILLGSQKKAFSTGELINLVQKGIQNGEYCSCGTPVPKCEVWSRIIKEWNKVRVLDLDEYIQIQKRLTSKKKIISTYFSLRNPSEEISQFLKDTNMLYKVIFQITGSEIIVDSSKAPGRLLILKMLDFDIKVIHLIRRFGDVLNSYKKTVEKDLEAGIEHDIVPLSSFYVFSSWSLKNLFTYLFSGNIPYKKVRYDKLVFSPENELSGIVNEDSEFANKLKQRGPFYPEHLVAGNSMRMKSYIYIANKPMNTTYNRLSRRDKIFAKFFDLFY